MSDLLWDLFKKTGKIEYYLKFKESQRLKENNDEKGRRYYR